MLYFLVLLDTYYKVMPTVSLIISDMEVLCLTLTQLLDSYVTLCYKKGIPQGIKRHC